MLKVKLRGRRLRMWCITGFGVLVSAAVFIWLIFAGDTPFTLYFLTGVLFTLLLVANIWLAIDPDMYVSDQSDMLFKTAVSTFPVLAEGLTKEAAQKLCETVLPSTLAIAAAITDRENVIGYAGYGAKNNQPVFPIQSKRIDSVFKDAKPLFIIKQNEIDFIASSGNIKAAIVGPLFIGETIVGTFSLFYKKTSDINKTQASIARGFGMLFSAELVSVALKEQRKLTEAMELKVLQTQINPHFLFNTLNTLASLTRTDPERARDLLREFAAFYRFVLEGSDGLIKLKDEIKQVQRYLSFEVARFGEDRLKLVIDIDDDMFDLYVPSFIIQPLVENAVKHAMRATGQLTITISGHQEEDAFKISIQDDGVGMSKEVLESNTEAKSNTGLGMSMKNVQSRIKLYYSPQSSISLQSKLNEGTTVELVLDKESALHAYEKTEKLKEFHDLSKSFASKDPK